MEATTYVYGRQVDGSSERFTILVATVPTGLLLHLEHRRKHGDARELLLSRIATLPPQQTVESWLSQQDAQLQADGWGSPARLAGIC